MKQSIYVSHYDIPTNVLQLISFLQKILDSIPEDLRGSLELEYELEDDYGGQYVSSDLWYSRPATPEELGKIERAKLAKDEVTKVMELQRLAELQAKYGEDV